MAYVDEVLADAPLGYWRLGETAGSTTVVDSSGNGRNLTTTGTPTFQQSSLLTNDANTAASFSGGSLASTPAAAWMIVPNFTVEAWFKTTSTANQTIASMDDSGGSPGETRRRWSVITSGGSVGFHIFAGGSVFYLQAAANCADGNPHHVVAVCENTMTRLYVDGVLAGKLTYSGALTGGVSTQNPLTIGSGYNQCPTTYWQFNGTIDEVAYYSTALSATRISTHYTASGRTIPAINNSSSYAQTVMADGPAGYWHLDESPGATLLRDSSGNNNNASPSSTNLPTLGATGVRASTGSAATFAASQYATVSDDPTISPTGAFTIEAWVKPTSVASGERYILEKYTNPGKDGVALRMEAMVPRAHILYATSYLTLDSTVALTAGVWSHVVVTYDLTTLRMYVNGQPAGTLATTTSPTDGPSSLLIAARADALANGIGTLDEVAIYTTALSASRVQAHYVAGVGIVPTLSNKVLWVRAKDLGAGGSSITTWPDQSGLAHDGTSFGTAPTVAGASTPIGGNSVQFSNVGHFEFGNVMGVATYTASTSYSGWPASNLGDGTSTADANSWSASTVSPGWVQAQAVSAVLVTGYAVTARASAPGSAPKTWTFSGSNDGTTWTTLDTRTGEIFSASQRKTYSYANSTSYKYYRMDITDTGTAGAWPSFSEFELLDSTSTSLNSPSGEIWAVVKSEASSRTGLWSFNTRVASNAHSFYPYDNGNAYETFGVYAANSPSFAYGTYPVNIWRIYRVVMDGTNLLTYLDGQLVNTLSVASMGGVSWGINSVIGRTYYNTSSTYAFTGKIAEVLVRKQVSTTQEASDIQNYLNSEHISATATSSQLDELYVDTLTVPTSTPRQLDEVYIDALTVPTVTPRYLYEIYVDVLTPAALSASYSGWGQPL